MTLFVVCPLFLVRDGLSGSTTELLGIGTEGVTKGGRRHDSTRIKSSGPGIQKTSDTGSTCRFPSKMLLGP